MIKESSIEPSNGSAYESGVSSLALPADRRDPRFRVFAILWAIATLFHMAHSSIFDRQLDLALLTMAAFLVVFRPSLSTFVLLILLQVFDAIFRMPVTTNHWIFTAFANLTMLQVLVFLTVKHRSFVISESEFLGHIEPLIRMEVIIMYFFAAFHKLNSDFLLASTSCASELLKAQHINHILPLTEGLLVANRYFTLLLEVSLPIMLVFRRTRNLGVIIGLVFHGVLSYSSYNGFYDFSSLMFASYFLFMGSRVRDAIIGALRTLKLNVKSFFQTFSVTRLVALTAAIVLGCAVLYVLNHSINNFRKVHLYFFWTVYSTLFLGLFIWYVFTRGRGADRASFKPAHWSFYFMPLIVFLNGTSPYLGLKTENSFAMFSNLRTEGGISNHLIVPVQAQIFDFQKDIVEISSSTDSLLQRMATEGKAMVLFEFQNYVNANTPDSVAYTINGRPGIFLERDVNTHAALGKNPYILRKVLKFRSFSPAGPQECSH